MGDEFKVDKMEGKEESPYAFKDLREVILAEENIKRIIEILKIIISEGAEYDIKVVAELNTLLSFDDYEVKCLTAQAIAELCKCEKLRIEYGQPHTVDKLLGFLKIPLTKYNSNLMKQTCRALGNICFESYVGRDLVLNGKGIPLIVELLPQTLLNDKVDNNKTHNSLRLYTCKLLLILLLGGSEYIQPALDCDFVAKDQEVIEYEFTSDSGDDDRLHTALLIMSVVTEYNRTLVMDEKLTSLIVDILKTVEHFEISEVCLEYLHHQSDHDSVKTFLAVSQVPQILWGLLDKYKQLVIDDDAKELKKLACDLIALILTGDDAMHRLYADGEGEFYLKMVNSLDSKDVELSITAILAIGNFARTDKHCTNMMDTGVFSKLMSILVLHKNHEDDIRLQHVVLSGLRNLVIPHRNKPLAIEYGILPLLIEMVSNVTQYHVVFKLLATLRMLVDGQEEVAVKLVSSNILDRVSKWGTQNEHAGVSGEASRLLARIVRQLQSRDLCIQIIKIKDCISCMVNMMTASHAIMQNEAIISLSILYVTCLFNRVKDGEDDGADTSPDGEYNKDEKLLVDQLIEANLADRLCTMIEKNSATMQKEIAENILKFITMLMKQPSLKERLCENSIGVNLQKMKLENKNLDETIKTSIDNLMPEIGEKQSEAAV